MGIRAWGFESKEGSLMSVHRVWDLGFRVERVCRITGLITLKILKQKGFGA